MTEVIDLTGQHGLISVNTIYSTKDENRMIAKFQKGNYWNLYKNDYYDESVKQIENEDEEAMKVFKGQISNIPIYNITKYEEKIGIALARYTKDGEDRPYLFIPQTYKGRYKISRHYYIFDVNDNHEIKHMARLMRK